MAVFSVAYRLADEHPVEESSPLIEALEALDSIRIHDAFWLISADTEQFVFFEYIKSHSRCCQSLVVFRVDNRPSLITTNPAAEAWLDRCFRR